MIANKGNGSNNLFVVTKNNFSNLHL
jgi:hypothetical protein